MILSSQICDDLLKLNKSLCVDVQCISIYWCIISFNSVKTLKTLRNGQTNNWIKTLLLSFILVCSTFYHLQWFHAISINHQDWPRQWLLIIIIIKNNSLESIPFRAASHTAVGDFRCFGLNTSTPVWEFMYGCRVFCHQLWSWYAYFMAKVMSVIPTLVRSPS